MHSQLRTAQAIRLRDTEDSALRANRSHVAQTKEVMLCVYSILLPSTVQPSASTGCSRCSTNSAAWKARCPATRDPGGDEASGDSDRELRQSPAGQADQGRCLKFWPVQFGSAPGFGGASVTLTASRGTRMNATA